MNVKPHDRFSTAYSLTPKMVADYALSVGDKNPVHHDPDFAAKTRYGQLIASGTHTTALILGLSASHFSKNTSMVGLDYWVGFRRPIYANETIKLEWLVVRVVTLRAPQPPTL